LAAWFRRDHIYLANVGDSRAVASICGEAIALTDDHKPMRKEEKYRIVRAGGFVSNDRILETLAVARSFGDFGFKVVKRFSFFNDGDEFSVSILRGCPFYLLFESLDIFL